MTTVSQAAKILMVSDRRVRALCIQGRIKGAKKEGRDWILPNDVKVIPGKRGQKSRISSLIDTD